MHVRGSKWLQKVLKANLAIERDLQNAYKVQERVNGARQRISWREMSENAHEEKENEKSAR